MTKVLSVAHLREMVQAGKHDFFVCSYLGLRSSKYINLLQDGRFSIVNEADDTEDVLTEEDIMDKRMTNVGEAITKGAFWCYE